MIKKVELDLGSGKILSMETGRLAKEADGSVIVRLGDTMVLATAVMAETPRPGIDFFPLLVDFEEKLYSVGRIPGGFFKREGKATEAAILTARRIDRPIRPLFPKGFLNDVQIVITPLSVDQENPPDILAIIGASAALAISGIPFKGPVAAARVAKIAGKFVVDPPTSEMAAATMDLVAAGTIEKILMIECGSNQVSEADILNALAEAHKRIREIIKLQQELIKVAGKPRVAVKLHKPNERLEKFINDHAADRLKKAVYLAEEEKRIDEIARLKEEIKVLIRDGCDEELKKALVDSPADINYVMAAIEKEFVRRLILEEGKRPDGRSFEEIREINCEVNILPRVHGSALFSRGQTQVLTVATLGGLGESQKLDGISPEEGKRYMHHYNFPAFSVGEVRPMRGPGRREIGHGALAEKALVPVIPGDDKFPYAIRLVSEVLASNGSTSMASTCASTLALMDAGVKISKPVAGISIGLVQSDKKEILLTDIQGLEDFLGDMDFKVAGTDSGITAIQVDVKTDGLALDLIEKILEKAKIARLSILQKMIAAIAAPRTELSPFAPRVTVIQIDPEKIGMVIGPGGKMIKKIVEETKAQIDIEDDGRVLITSSDQEGARQARRMIEDITFEPEVGNVFRGKVTRILPFGAFVEIVPGKEGLVHISQISQRRIAKVEDELSVGDEIVVKLVEVDDMGRLNLSRKAVTAEDEAKIH
ncbi:polyribonucleotide nucleotidyltransferase [Candidatus Saganbacteria bacterium]|nr:polyribonucleotide nucleotidyltransferase [Candidatus Saganbacteria bacterium]